MERRFRERFLLSAAAGLAFALTACGPDDSASSTTQPGSAAEWPMDALSLGGPINPDSLPPLPEAVPMEAGLPKAPVSYVASRSSRGAGGYGYAPSYYDDGYYRDQPSDWYADDASAQDGSSYAPLGLAALLGSVLGNAPPDYGFGYGDTQPWVWETGDRYRRYAEPVDGGYRYYYYAPDRDRPFLVSDPYYSYAYRNDRIAYIYDRDGRIIDSRRALRQRQVGERYASRGYDLYRASRRDRSGVSAPLWAQRRDQILRQQAQWDHARQQRRAWQDWDRRHDDVIAARWTRERAARRFASDRFENWRRADYRGQAPRFYREAARDKKLRQAVLARQSALYRQAEQKRAQDRRQQAALRAEQRSNRAQAQRQLQQARAEAARDQRRDQQQNQRQARMARQEQKVRQQKVRERQQVRAQQLQARQDQQARRKQQMAQSQRQVRAQQLKARQAQARQAQARKAQARKAQVQQARVQQERAQQAKVRRDKQQQQAAQRQRQARAQEAKARQGQVRQQRQAAQRQRQAQAQQAAQRQRQAQARQAQARQRQQSARRAEQARSQQARRQQVRMQQVQGKARRDLAARGDKREMR